MVNNKKQGSFYEKAKEVANDLPRDARTYFNAYCSKHCADCSAHANGVYKDKHVEGCLLIHEAKLYNLYRSVGDLIKDNIKDIDIWL